MARRRWVAPVTGAAVLGLVAACSAFAWPEQSTLVPRNAGRPAGDELWAQLFIVCAALALVLYAVGLTAVARLGARRATVAAVAVAIQVAPLGAPLLLSTDAWTYWDQGRIAAVHGASPYREPPSAFPADPAYPWVGEAWRDTPSVYGPAFTLASEPLALAAGSSEDAAAWTYKSIGAFAVLAAAFLAARHSRRPVLATAFVGWNPLLALHFGGGGHNDAWLAALVVGALVLSQRGRRHEEGFVWSLAVLVKWIPFPLLVLRALEGRATRRGFGYLGMAAGAMLVATLATWRYGLSWLEAFGPLARNANDETSFALVHRVQQAGAPRELALALALLVFTIGYAWLARQAWRGRARLGLAACLLLVVSPYLAPWYVIWAVAPAAAEDDRTAQLLAVGLCAYLLPQTIPV